MFYFIHRLHWKQEGANNAFRMLLRQIRSVLNCRQVFLLNNQVLINRESIISIQIHFKKSTITDKIRYKYNITTTPLYKITYKYEITFL